MRKVYSPCPRLYIAAAVAINTTVSGVIRTWALIHRSQTRLLRPAIGRILPAYLVADRLEDEARESQKRRDELAELKCELRHKERCISELSSQNDCLRAELDLAATKLDKYSREADAANQRYVLYSSASAGQWTSRTFGRSERSSHLGAQWRI